MNNNITNERIAKALCYGKNMKRKIVLDAVEQEMKDGALAPWNKIQDLIIDEHATIGLLRDCGISEEILQMVNDYTFNNEYFHIMFYENIMDDLKVLHQNKIITQMSMYPYNRTKYITELKNLDYLYMVKINFTHCSMEEILLEQKNEGTPWFSDGLNALLGPHKQGTARGIVCPINVGKTTYLTIQAAEVAKRGTKVLFLFNEMTQPQIEKKIFGYFQENKINDITDWNKTKFEEYKSMVDVMKLPIRNSIEQAANDVISAICSSDAELVLMDYMQLGAGGSDAYGMSSAYNDYIQIITEFIEDEKRNTNKTSFLFSVQANTQHFGYKERIQMDTKVKSCSTLHQHLDCFVGMTALTPEENIDEIRKGFALGCASRPCYVDRWSNVRCFTVLKAREDEAKYKGYTIYQYLSDEKTYTVGIARNCTTVDGKTYPLFLQCGYDEVGNFWWKDEVWKDVEINMKEAKPVDMEVELEDGLC